MSSRTGTYIFDRQTGEYVEATLVDGLTKEEIDAAENAWRPVMDEAVKKKREAGQRPPQHARWDWREKYALCGDILLYQFLGVECAGQMQGMMLLQTANVFCRHRERLGKGLVYVAYIATAPWNSPEVVPEPRYKQVGSVLINGAVQISLDLGFGGCVGLHSLPQSEDWYANRCGMTDFGIDQKEELRYFEMTLEQAAAFIRGG